MRLSLIPFLLIGLLLSTRPAIAIYDPRLEPNNKYGIHIADTNDIPDAVSLVNSSGGDWGYVTLVIQETDRDGGKWQKIFNELRRLHLIPIVRLATHVEGDAWVQPKLEDAQVWTEFLNSLNWPVENRYVVIFNEPNHAKEWGNTLDPEGYARAFTALAQALKQASEDFFVLPAGLDVSAASDGQSLDAAVFLRQMVTAQPEVLNLLDGWVSHSYPNPGFSGSPYTFGRGTLRSYQWEFNQLQALGLHQDIPVFITETGWVHSQGKTFNPQLLSEQAVGSNFSTAASLVWTDPRIVALTPFVFNYQDYPFDHFSFKRLADNSYYSHYYSYQSIPKTGGRPRQRETYELTAPLLPKTLVAGSTYSFSSTVKNGGQGILTAPEYELQIWQDSGLFQVVTEAVPYAEPGDSGRLALHLKIPDRPGSYPFTLVLKRGKREFPIQKGQLEIVPPPTLSLKVKLSWRKKSSAKLATVLVYDQEATLLHKFTNVTIADGQVKVEGLRNIVPGNAYRIVILVPYYLPRQAVLPLSADTTEVVFKRMLALDFSADGALNFSDLKALISSPPQQVLLRFFGP